MRRKNLIKKLLILTIAALAIFGLVNIKVDATGYTYDHKGKVIYSTDGFTVNQTPYIYETLGISAKSFSEANPSDLFVYNAKDLGAKDEADGFNGTIVYMLDSGGSTSSSTLYVFDSNLGLKRQISSLRYSPATLVANNTNISMIKSGKTKIVDSSANATKYTVKFVDGMDDTELATQQVVSGSSATAVFPGSHEGYHFDGWDTALNNVTSDLTIKSKFVANSEAAVYTITFKDSVNSKTIGTIDLLSGASVIYPEVPTHAGYEFTGWSSTIDKVTKDETVTANFSEVFTVTYQYEKATDQFETIDTVEALKDGKATAPFVPFIDGYVFAGWTLDDAEASLTKVTKNLVATAKYEEVNAENPVVKVTYIDGLSSTVLGEENVKVGGNATFPTAKSHDGYVFAGWDNKGEALDTDTTITATYKKLETGLDEATFMAQAEMTLTMAGANSVYRGVSSNSYPVTDYIYICDTANNQVLVIDATSYQETEPGKGTYEVVQIVTSPVGEIGTATFSPLKVVNDAAGRIYTICEGIEDGILEFSETGSFDRYVGTNYVTLSAWEIFTRNFATEAQLDQFTTYQNTTFTSMVYKNNMIYTTSYSIKNSNGTTNDTIMIKKINPSGKDVLRRNGYNPPKGDVTYTQYNDDNGSYGASQFVGITVNEYGVYTVVDNKRGRLFTYDNEGNLLYISGGSGSQLDKINIPIAVQYLGDNILVLDSKRKAIIVFEPTDIAKVINKAIQCEYNGYSEQAYEYWEDVIRLNANYEYAYVGIGKHYMEETDLENNYQIAMNYFELGANQVYYSKAFKQYRDGIIKKWFPYVVTGIIVLAVGGTVYKKVRRKKLGIKEEEMTGMGDE